MSNLNTAYERVLAACRDPNIGYSQAQRTTIKLGVSYKTYCDCSSLISWALTEAGYFASNPWFSTSYMGQVLLDSGWKVVSPSSPWKNGDILWRQGHCEMVYDASNHISMGAHTESLPFADQVSVNKYSSEGKYEKIYRDPYGSVGSGISIYVISAMCGNFWQESHCNPGLWENKQVGQWDGLKHGYGLGGWTNTNGDTHGRLWQLHEYLQKHGFADNSGPGQLDFLIEENVWQSVREASGFKNLQEFLHSDSTDIEMLTHAWNAGWEGIHDASWDARVTYAMRCYDFISQHAEDPTITEWISYNDYLSDPDKLNNAVLIYRYLSKGSPIPPGGVGFFIWGALAELRRRKRLL